MSRAALRRALTRQTRTAVAAAVTFVGLAVALVLVPVPFVTWTPGDTYDTLGTVDAQPMISVAGTETYPTTGRLDLTVVSVTSAGSGLALPQALAAYWLPNRDALPRESVYPSGKSPAQVADEDAERMETAQDDAVVAALRAADRRVQELPAVTSVTVGGPAHRSLEPGDLVVSVDGVTTPTAAAVSRAIRAHRPGEQVRFEVLRERKRTAATVTAAASATQAGISVVGITLGPGYRYDPEIDFELARRIGGPSAGLVFALAIYDKITPGALLADRHLAGTGSITPEGVVGAIGGLQEKIAGAEDAGATAFLVPAGNCADLAGVQTGMELVKVETLADGIAAVQALAGPDGSRVPRC